MNPKSLILLEYHKVLAKLTAFASFSASAELSANLRPTSNLEKAIENAREFTGELVARLKEISQ